MTKRQTKAQRAAVRDAKAATKWLRRAVAANKTEAIRLKARTELLREIGALRSHGLKVRAEEESRAMCDIGPTEALRSVFRQMFGGHPEGLVWPVPSEEAQDVIDWINMSSSTEFMVWSTGIGAFDAAEFTVSEAIANGNIRPLDSAEDIARLRGGDDD